MSSTKTAATPFNNLLVGKFHVMVVIFWEPLNRVSRTPAPWVVAKLLNMVFIDALLIMVVSPELLPALLNTGLDVFGSVALRARSSSAATHGRRHSAATRAGTSMPCAAASRSVCVAR
jgi:hypothetical protein